MISWKLLMLARSFFSPAAAFVLVVTFLAGTPMAAQLKWQATTVEQRLTLGQEEAEASFPFENSGSYPVVIQSTSSSCGCTTAKLDRKTYYPGDKGEIVTHFDVGNRTGHRRNTVQVTTDDPTARNITLTFAVEIPSLITFTPRLLHWRLGEEATKKTVRIQVAPEAEVKVKDVEIEGDGFDAVLVETEKDGEYELELTPRETNSRNRAIISLQTDPELENRTHFSFYAYVR